MNIFDKDISTIHFTYRDHLPDLTSEELKSAEEFWVEELKKHPYTFNGTHFACDRVEIQNEGVHIYLNKTEYKYNIWARERRISKPGTRAVTTGCLLMDKENYYIVRRDNVATGSGKIGSVIGCLDYKDTDMQNFSNYIKEITLKELEEEVVLDKSINTDDLNFLGLTYDSSQSLLAFRFVAYAKPLKCANDENNEVIPIRKSEMRTYYLENAKIFVTSDGPFIKKLTKIVANVVPYSRPEDMAAKRISTGQSNKTS